MHDSIGIIHSLVRVYDISLVVTPGWTLYIPPDLFTVYIRSAVESIEVIYRGEWVTLLRFVASMSLRP
jgi:hypothetical protein